MSSISVSSVGSLAYCGDTSLTSATVASGAIGEFAFYECTSLTDVSFGGTVSAVLAYAYYGCSSLTTVILPASVSQIGDCAFANCAALTTVRVMNANITISKSAFASSNVTVHYPDGTTKTGAAAGNGVVYSSGAFLDIESATKTCLGVSVTGEYPQPSIIAIPNGVLTCLPGFSNAVTSIYFPPSLTEIGESAFEDNEFLTSVVFDLSAAAINIGNIAFKGTGIQSIELPATVTFTSVQYSEDGTPQTEPAAAMPFGRCPNLTTVIFNGPNTTGLKLYATFYECINLTSVSLPDGLLELGGTFFGCTSLSSITIPSSVTVIGSNTFSSCPLTAITLPSSLVEIGQSAFVSTQLTQVTIPSTVRKIGSTAFACDTLQNVSYADISGITDCYLVSQSAYYLENDGASLIDLAETENPDYINYSAFVGPSVFVGTPYLSSLYAADNGISNLQVNPISDTTVGLSWSAPSKNAPLIQYQVLLNGTVVSTLPCYTTSYTAALDYSMEYTIKVRMIVDGLFLSRAASLTASYDTLGKSPAWWSAFTTNRVALLTTLAQRYVPQLLTQSRPLSYYLSNGGAFSGSYAEWETAWKAVITQDATSIKKVQAANVMLLNIFNQLLTSADSTTQTRGENKFKALIPNVIDLAPSKPTISHIENGQSIYLSWTQPAYFWDCYRGYNVYLNGSLVASDVSAGYYLLQGVSADTHTVGVAAVNLLGVEGQKQTATISVGAAPEWLSELTTSTCRAIVINGTTSVGLNDRATISTASGTLSIRPRMLGAFGFEMQSPAAPSVPSDVSAVVSGKGRATISWKQSETDNPAPHNYLITAVDVGTDSSWIIDTSSAALAYTVMDLSAGSSYKFKVKAVSTFDSSDWSGFSTVIQASSTAGAPVAPTLTTTGQGRLSVAWEPPSNTGNAEILSYTIELVDVSNAANNQTYTDVLLSPFSITGKTSSYKARVRAVNENGDGAWSDYSATVIPNAIPVAIQDLSGQITEANGNDITLTWSTPNLNGGPPLTSYVLTRNGVSQDISANTNTYTYTDVSYGVAHLFNVRAKNINGTAANSNQISLTPLSVPGIPQLTFVVNYQIGTIQWNAPTFTGGTSITGYTIEVLSSDIGINGSQYATITDASSTTYILSGLPVGASYAARVCARNVAGSGQFSDWKTGGIATEPTAPSSPTNVRITQESAPLTVEWNVPDSTNGSALTGYEVKAYLGGSTTTYTLGPNTRARSFPDISNGVSYLVEVRAVNAYGSSAPAVLDRTVLQNLVATATDDKELTISWDAPDVHGFPAVDSYVVSYRLDDETDPSGTTVSTTQTTLTLTDLSANSAWLRAFAGGDSNPDPTLGNIDYLISVKTAQSTRFADVSEAPITAPAAPQNLTASQDASGYITASWAAPVFPYGITPPIDNGGTPIIAYVIDISSASDFYQYTVSGDVLSLPSKSYLPTVAGDYTVRVYAENAVAIGAAASTNVAATTIPNPPTNLLISPLTASTAIVAWTAPQYTGGLPVQSYEIERVKIATGYSFDMYVNDLLFEIDRGVATDISSTDVDAFQFTVEGLVTTNIYAVRVRTVSSRGVSAWSERIPMQTYPDNTILDVSAEQVGNNIVVSWEAPNNNIYGYYLIGFKDGVNITGTVWLPTALFASTPEFSFSPDQLPLLNGTYSFRVYAKSNANEAGAWTFSNNVEYVAGPLPALPQLLVAPSPPTNISASPVDQNNITLSWTPAANENSLPIEIYDIEYVCIVLTRFNSPVDYPYDTNVQGKLTQLNNNESIGGTTLTKTVSGDYVSTNLTGYGIGPQFTCFIRVRAGANTDGGWKSDWSPYTVFSMGDYDQESVALVSALPRSPTTSMQTIQWTLLSSKPKYSVEYIDVNENGAPYRGYGGSGAGEDIWMFDLSASSIASVGVGSLTNGNTYKFRVAPYNSYMARVGSWVYSDDITYIAPPTNISIKATTGVSSELVVSWTAPTPNTNIVDSYKVYRKRNNLTDEFQLVGTSTSTSFVDSGLTIGEYYVYTVVSVSNTLGMSADAYPFGYGTPLELLAPSNVITKIIAKETVAAPGASKDTVLSNGIGAISSAFDVIPDTETAVKQTFLTSLATQTIGDKLSTLSSGSPTLATKVSELKNTFFTLSTGLPVAAQEKLATAVITQIKDSTALTTAEKAVAILSTANAVGTSSSEKKTEIIKSLATVATFTDAPISLNAEQTSALVAAFGSVSEPPATIDVVVPKTTTTTTLTSTDAVYMPLQIGVNYPIKYGTETVQVKYTIPPQGIAQITLTRANSSTETYTVGASVSIGGGSFRLFAVGGVGFQGGGGNGGGGNGGGAVCFFGNAPVLTPSGYKTMDSLQVGDYVQTADGRAVQIQRVFHQRIAASPQTNPFRIPRGHFGATQSVLISPDHRVAIAGRGMVAACHLGLQQVAREGILDYYNLELPNWKRDNMVVAGVAVESLAPIRRVCVDRATFIQLLRETYGNTLSTGDITKIMRKCVFNADGTVEAPFMHKQYSA